MADEDKVVHEDDDLVISVDEKGLVTVRRKHYSGHQVRLELDTRLDFIEITCPNGTLIPGGSGIIHAVPGRPRVPDY